MYILAPELLAPKLLTWVRAAWARFRGVVGAISSSKTGDDLTLLAMRASAAEIWVRNFMFAG